MTVYKIGAARRPTADLDTFVGEVGDIFYSVDDTCLRISDGKTPGGLRINIDCFDGLDRLQSDGGGGTAIGGLTIEMLQALETNIAPLTANTYDLGKSGYEWRELYLSGPNIYIGGVVITVNANGGITLPNNSKIDGNTFYINDQSITYNNNSFVFDSSITVQGNTLTLGGQPIYINENNNLVLPQGTKVAGNTFYLGDKSITFDVDLNSFVFDGNISLSQLIAQNITLGDQSITTNIDNGTTYLSLPSGTRVDGTSFWIGDLEIKYNVDADILELPCGTKVCGENFYIGDHQIKLGADSTKSLVLPPGTTIEGDRFLLGDIEIYYDPTINNLVLPTGTKILSDDGTYKSVEPGVYTADDLQLELYLEDLLNIDVSTRLEGSVLQYQGTKWKAKDARALGTATDNDLLLSGGVY